MKPCFDCYWANQDIWTGDIESNLWELLDVEARKPDGSYKCAEEILCEAVDNYCHDKQFDAVEPCDNYTAMYDDLDELIEYNRSEFQKEWDAYLTGWGVDDYTE